MWVCVCVLGVGGGHSCYGGGPGAVEQVVLENLLLLDDMCRLVEFCWGILWGMAPMDLLLLRRLLCLLCLPPALHKRRWVFSVLVSPCRDGVAGELCHRDVNVRGVERRLVIAGYRVDHHGWNWWRCSLSLVLVVLL